MFYGHHNGQMLSLPCLRIRGRHPPVMMQGSQTFVAIVAMPNDFSLQEDDDDGADLPVLE